MGGADGGGDPLAARTWSLWVVASTFGTGWWLRTYHSSPGVTQLCSSRLLGSSAVHGLLAWSFRAGCTGGSFANGSEASSLGDAATSCGGMWVVASERGSTPEAVHHASMLSRASWPEL